MVASSKNMPGAKSDPVDPANLATRVSPTSPDKTSEAAKLGGKTVEKLKTPAKDQKPEPGMDKASGKNEMRLIPNDATLLVGNHYTAELQLDKDVSEENGDVVMFIHPAGWDVKAAVVGHVASGTFIIERPQTFTFGFKVNGKKVASASYETRDA